MSGHGHVKPNPDGSLAHCGGPGICDVCSREAASEWWAMRAERDDAEDFLWRHGYRRCDIPACNCGSWHGGHANMRLIELREAFEQDEHTDTNGKTLLGLVCEVLTERDALLDAAERAEAAERELAEAQRDAERFEWWFSRDVDKRDFLPTYFHGIRERWSLSTWRAAIDAERGKR